ncbi:hypothetical protein [Kutzneria sp. NPDC051319]
MRTRNKKRLILGALLLTVALSPMWGHIYGSSDSASPAAMAVV